MVSTSNDGSFGRDSKPAARNQSTSTWTNRTRLRLVALSALFALVLLEATRLVSPRLRPPAHPITGRIIAGIATVADDSGTP
jgi:hypothetical protein